MTSPTPAALRDFFREAERHLLRQHPGRLPQAAQAWALRARHLASLDDAELQGIIDESAGMPEEKLLQALSGFEAMYSDPRVRVIDTLPGGLHEAASAIARSGRVPACRHILAGAAAGSVLPAGVCILHPPLAQCPACLEEHVAAGHDARAELTCDWCGAECLHRIFPVTLHLGPVTAVRSPGDTTSYAVGPAVIAGLGACYRCYRDVVGPIEDDRRRVRAAAAAVIRPAGPGRGALARPRLRRRPVQVAACRRPGRDRRRESRRAGHPALRAVGAAGRGRAARAPLAAAAGRAASRLSTSVLTAAAAIPAAAAGTPDSRTAPTITAPMSLTVLISPVLRTRSFTIPCRPAVLIQSITWSAHSPACLSLIPGSAVPVSPSPVRCASISALASAGKSSARCRRRMPAPGSEAASRNSFPAASRLRSRDG